MAVAGQQVRNLLENLASHRNDLKLKIEKDELIQIQLRAEIGELEDTREEIEIRLHKAERLKKRYDTNIQETTEAMENLDTTARRFASTFASLGKLKKENRVSAS
jgi:predicted  nucleic acid-binding Zn-ribbon protein